MKPKLLHFCHRTIPFVAAVSFGYLFLVSLLSLLLFIGLFISPSVDFTIGGAFFLFGVALLGPILGTLLWGHKVVSRQTTSNTARKIFWPIATVIYTVLGGFTFLAARTVIDTRYYHLRVLALLPPILSLLALVITYSTPQEQLFSEPRNA